MQDIELHRQLKLINAKKDHYAKYQLSSSKPSLLLDVEKYLSKRHGRIEEISKSNAMSLSIKKMDQSCNKFYTGQDSRTNQKNGKRMQHRLSINILPDKMFNVFKRSMIDDKSGKSDFFLTALQMENKGNLNQKFKSIVCSVRIFLSFFHWIAAKTRTKLQWSWAYDPATYLYKNPFKDTSISDVAVTQNTTQLLECYSGWMKDDIRSILRIHPLERTDRHIDILMKYFSTMKSFKKYNLQSRREFLIKGEYNSWDEGRHIIKEGYPACAIYFILDGEVSVCTMKDKTKLCSHYALNEENGVERNRQKCWDQSNMIRLTTMYSGDCFGEVAFTMMSDQCRSATVKTVRKTEFLIIEIKDAAQIINAHNDFSFNRKMDFLASLPLIRTLRVEPKTLAYYCSFKSVSINAPLLIEGENSENIYFIKSGSCRLLKTVKIQKIQNGDFFLNTLDKVGLPSKVLKSETQVPCFHVEYQLVVVGQLKEGDHFGEGSLVNDYPELLWANGAIGCGSSRFSVVTNGRTEIMSIPKAKLHNFATENTWNYILDKSKEISRLTLFESYETILKWTEMKTKICKELKPQFSTAKAAYI